MAILSHEKMSVNSTAAMNGYGPKTSKNSQREI